MRAYNIDTGRRRDVSRFIELPFRLYRDCPQWVPPLRSDLRHTMDRDTHPFYEHSEGDFFLVEDGHEVLGRVGVFANRHFNDYHGSKTAFFYFFECVDDADASGLLFEAAFDWARNHDLDTIIGPKGMLRSDGHGLLVEGFDHTPAPGIPYNLPYLTDLVTAAGFVKELDYPSGYLAADYELDPRFERLASRVMERSGFWIRTFTSKEELLKLVPGIQRIYNEAFKPVFGYYPVDDKEIAAIAQRLLSIADPRLIKLVMCGEEVAGFTFAYPDISKGLQKARGRMWPFGWWHLMRAFKSYDKLSLNGFGMLPKYQGLGATAILYSELAKSVKSSRAVGADVAQVAETNMKSLGEMRTLGVEWYKVHRIYKKVL